MAPDVHLHEGLVPHINEYYSISDRSAEVTVEQAYLLLHKFISEIPKSEGQENVMLLDWNEIKGEEHLTPGKSLSTNIYK